MSSDSKNRFDSRWPFSHRAEASRLSPISRSNMTKLKAVVCWTLFSLLAISSSLAQENRPSDKQKSCRDFVQAFYDWYAPKALENDRGRAWDFALQYKPSAFSPELLQALKDDSQAQAKVKGEIVGLDFDPFLNSQDPSPHYFLGSVSCRDDDCSVEVYGVSSSGKRDTTVRPELALRNKHWIFVNFHYGKSKFSEDENLVTTLQGLQAERRRYPK